MAARIFIFEVLVSFREVSDSGQAHFNFQPRDLSRRCENLNPEDFPAQANLFFGMDDSGLPIFSFRELVRSSISIRVSQTP